MRGARLDVGTKMDPSKVKIEIQQPSGDEDQVPQFEIK